MDALIDLSWRIYPATALVGLGAAFLYRGLRKGSAGLKRGSAGSSDMASFVLGFRLAVISIALAGLGVAWIGHVTWLLVLSRSSAAKRYSSRPPTLPSCDGGVVRQPPTPPCRRNAAARALRPTHLVEGR